MTIRVVQWTTGRVAAAAVRGVLADPELELVGAFAWSPDKAGRDVGELVGLPALGVHATSSIDEVIALEPDVVLYMPLIWDVDHMVRLLEAGINLISTSNFITGRSYGEDAMTKLRHAAESGGATLYGTGISPGVVNTLALCAAAAVRELERISITEAADVSGYQSRETWEALGFAQPPDSPGLVEMARARQAVFHDVLEMMADALGVELDAVEFRLEVAVARRDVDLGWMQIPAGTVCAQRGTWTGTYHGRTLLDKSLTWWLTADMEPDLSSELFGHRIEIVGIPSLRIESHLVRDGLDPELAGSPETANAAVNAIRAVVAAPPGLVTAADLPLVTTRIVRP